MLSPPLARGAVDNALSTPVGRINPGLYPAVKGGMWPLCDRRHMNMLHGVVMDIVHMTSIIVFVADGMLPETALPNAPLRTRHPHR